MFGRKTLPHRAAASQVPVLYLAPMKYRVLGRSGLKVSEIGFGAWGIGRRMWRGADDGESLRALHLAAENGLNFIDTALAYGGGHSERLIGRFLGDTEVPVHVATKAPPLNQRWAAQGALQEVFPRHYLISSTEQSLENLGVECLDLMQLHVWSPDWIQQDEWHQTLLDLKAAGKVSHFGISVGEHEPGTAVDVVRSGRIDTVQVIYNIFDQSAEQELFGACEEMRVGVIARVPFDEGALTGAITADTRFSKKDWRNRYFRGDRKERVQEHVQQLSRLLGDEVQSLAELALRFCLQPRVVSTVIPGMRSTPHVRANLAVSDLPPLSPNLMTELKRHAWAKNFYF